MESWSRRDFLRASASAAAAAAAAAAIPTILEGQALGQQATAKRMNVVFVFGDQWRAAATGYAGDPNVQTANLDALARRSVNFTTAVSSCPVCSPYRASMLTGTYPLTHGVFLNDVHLGDSATSIAEAFKAGGYDTGYIGKWHVNDHGRLSFIRPEHRQGFDYWRVCECTHQYNKSVYYGDENRRLTWEGYDAAAQTADAIGYIRGGGRDKAKPFLLMLSWGPPHNPYETAPKRFGEMYDPAKIELRPNVPARARAAARRDLAGYYAHCSALDACVGELLAALRDAGLEDNTLFVFTSDHGDMLYSQGQQRKQRPWDESIRVPLLMHAPGLFGAAGRQVATPIVEPDLMPTLLGLCGLPIPKTVEGRDYSPLLLGRGKFDAPGALIACYSPFGEFASGKEYRGVRTERYTYVRTLKGPWLLYDNQADPCQQTNLVNQPAQARLQTEMEAILARLLAERKDEFRPGREYIAKWGWKTDRNGTAATHP